MTTPAPAKNSYYRDRFGLMLIGASLLVAVFISAYLIHHQRDARIADMRAQGLSLVQVLGSMPLSRLAPTSPHVGVLSTLLQTQRHSNLSYVAVTDPAATPLAQVALADVRVPAPLLAGEAGNWLGERSLPADGVSGHLLEFYGPVFEQGERVAQVRIGYRLPGYLPAAAQVPLFGTLAFAVFVLTVVFLFLIKREMRPIGRASQKLEQLGGTQAQNLAKAASKGALHELSERFSEVLDATNQRIQSLEELRTDDVMSNKLLMYQKARIESALQSLPEAVLVVDEGGVVTYANARVSSLLGQNAEALIGQTAKEWCQEEAVLELFASCQRDMARTYRGEAVQFAPAHAPDQMMSVSPHPLFSSKSAGEQLGTLFVFRDVSDEVAAKRARGEFVAHVAHELKTPLNVIQMYSETLQEDAGKTPELTVEATNVIHDEVERLATLISNLLSMTQIEMGMVALDRQRTRLNDLVEDVVDNVRRAAKGKDIEFNVEVPREISSIAVDKELLRIAINNLLTNAIKYNKPGGQVSISLSEDDDQMRLSIIDTGIGIAADDQARIFDKFFRSERDEVRERSGHGLGLALAHQIVSLHHGELQLESELGVGTVFTLVFDKDTGIFRQAI